MAAPIKGTFVLAQGSNSFLPGSLSNDFLMITGNSNQSILFGACNAQTYLKLNSNGFIGVGKSNPAYTLDVLGNINFTGALTSNGQPFTSGGGGGAGGIGWSNGQTTNQIYTLSNVGIGISNPQAQLHLTSNLRVDGSLQLQNNMQFGGIEVLPGNINTNSTVATISSLAGYSNQYYANSNVLAITLSSNTSNDSVRFQALSNELIRLTGQGHMQFRGATGHFSPKDFGLCNFSIPGYIQGSSVITSNSQPFPQDLTEGALVFPGTLSNFFFLSNAAMNFNWWQTGFTLEAWVRYSNFTNAASNLIPCTMGCMMSSNTGNSFTLGANNSGNLTFYYFNGSETKVTTTTTMQANVWNHIAVTYDLTNIRLFINGTVGNTPANYSGTPNQNTDLAFVIGQYNNVNPNFQITNIRYTRGAALYTANFTPSTLPLTTQSNGNNILLIRVPMDPPKLLPQKIGGTTAFQEYPPAPMTANVTNIQNASYGQGTYIATASVQNVNYANYNAFDKSLSTQWTNNGNYSGTTPFQYTGTVTTVDTLGISYAGDWLQLELPVPINLSSYRVHGHQINTYYLQGPSQWWLMGSVDGYRWQVINFQTNIQWSSASPQTFNVDVASPYRYYRMVVGRVAGASANTLTITDLAFFGVQENMNITQDGYVTLGSSDPKQLLEVGGNALISGNVSANNMFMFRNRIINGDMRIDQRSNGGTYTNSVNYTLDRYVCSRNTSSATLNVMRSNISYPHFDFTYALSATIGTGNSTIGNGDAYLLMWQPIEGINVADLLWGTPNARPVTVSFWVRSSISHTFYLSVRNTSTRSYVTPFNCIANQWQYFTFTVPGDVTGTWPTDKTASIYVSIYTATGSQYSTSTSNIWNAGIYAAITGSTSTFIATSGNNFMITGLQLEKGTIATPFEFRPYATELQLCKRYYQKFGTGLFGRWNSSTEISLFLQFNPPLRAAPNTSTTANVSLAKTSAYMGVLGTGNVTATGLTAAWQSVAFTYNTINGAYLFLTNTSANGGSAGAMGVLLEDIIVLDVEL